MTPLFYAASNKCKELVQLLLSNGARASVEDKVGMQLGTVPPALALRLARSLQWGGTAADYTIDADIKRMFIDVRPDVLQALPLALPCAQRLP
jgi:ankyrin repeat protein